ncbi:MAG: hypothetical protein WED06_01090 [Candidatus Paceibacterota bacterium]
METKEIAALIVVLLYLISALRYCWQTVKGQIRPVFATWLLFAVATGLSLATYFSSEKHSAVSNIGNVCDATATWSVFLVISIFAKNKIWGFNRFEKRCLLAAGLIVIFWIFSREHVVANLLLQSLITVGYLPMIRSLWRTVGNTESFLAWSLCLIAVIVSIYPAAAGDDSLALTYVLRGLGCVSLTLLIMLRAELRSHKLTSLGKWR